MSDSKTKVLVLGGTGMLGAMVVDVLSHEPGLAVTATARDAKLVLACAKAIPSVDWTVWDAERESAGETLPGNGPFAWVVNCIGVIKPYIKDDVAPQVVRAVRVNALFPHRLAAMAQAAGARVIQIATDCVYSGRDGNYAEDALHDALDVYGKTKSLGEVPGAPHFHNVRCSIIGPEPKGKVSLLEWFLKQPKDGSVTGFLNHRWNGVTTLHFAKVCAGAIRVGMVLPSRQHLVPTGDLPKADMLDCFAKGYGRGDLVVNRADAATVVDRTLSTKNNDVSAALWCAAGYAVPPTVPEMIAEMAAFRFRLTDLDGIAK